MNETIYSQHHFMFPFRWDILPKDFKISKIKEDESFDKRTDLTDSLFENIENWNRKSFELHNKSGDIDPEKYNEFTYFHDFVQKAVFDFEYPWKNKQQIMKYYEYDLDNEKDNKYLIEYLEKVNKDDWNCDKLETLQLELKLDGITLHFFNTGVGVLTYNLSNKLESQKEKESILKINEFGRRMYPQFLGNNNGIEETQKNFLPKSITLLVNGNTLAIEDFSFYRLNNKALTVAEPYRLPTYIQNLFTNAVIFRLDESKLLEKQILITKVTDDRMFFHSWYGDSDNSTRLSKIFLTDNWWYSYIFGDKESPSVQNKKMQVAQTKNHTYDRWLNYGALYGMSRDSFVCVANDKMASIVRIHMNTMYYTLSVLCLAQRTSVLKFTAEVANLADLAKIDPDKKLIDNIKGVYKNYIEFINKLYFREITPQIQGIEIYNQFQKILNLENEIKDLDGEISELHEYVSLIQTERQNNNAAILNGIAMVFLPFTVVFGVLGANIFGNNIWHDFKKGTADDNAIGGLIIGFGISFVLIGLLFMTQYLIKKNKK